MQLAKIEKDFMSCLLKPDQDSSSFLSQLLPLKFIDAEKQLFIYLSNVNGAHQKVLGQVYPACFNILGADYFNQLCRIYRLEYPSVDADLNVYGEYFSCFIEKQIEDNVELNGFEYLTDLTKLEWSWHFCYFSKGDEDFSFAKLESVKEAEQGNLVFKLSGSISLHSTLYPVLDIWHANKSNVEEQQGFMLPESDIYFCILQVEHKPELVVLDEKQYKLLSYISKGLSLNEINTYMQDDFQQELMAFIQSKWVVGFSLTGKI